ncbi:hypothetical protein GCM10010492_61450 [Saccharothrix mutabilis subsp. mutabilis]|uniref:Uncharacterized protein n=1 Tax=Saccharothrix mutabilis subsp. mutabilis TaxID=66855 RepID=A0ABN0UK01_9PSEU
MLSRANPAVNPDNNVTNMVINTTTAPINANRPRANRRSLHATNTADPSRADTTPSSLPPASAVDIAPGNACRAPKCGAGSQPFG